MAMYICMQDKDAWGSCENEINNLHVVGLPLHRGGAALA